MRSALIALALASALTACHKSEAPAAARGPVEVSVRTIEPRDTPVSFEYVGQTQSSRQVQIVARVNGFLERRLYTEGSLVKAGQVMFQQDPRPFQAQVDAAKAALAEQQARLKVANDNLARVKPLAARKALSQRELDDATGAAETAAAAVDVAKANLEQAQLNLSYTRITTPVTGVSSYARVQDGQYVNLADSQLTYVAQLDPMWVNFSLSENDMLKLRSEQQAGRLKLPAKEDFEVEVILADGSTFPRKGRITFANADYNQQTGTFMLRATLPNPEGVLRPGQFVRVRVLGAVRPGAVLVPQQAVLQGASGHFVIVVDKDNHAQIRPVEVGPWQGDEWFILKGLAAGDVVVTDGVVRLSPGAAVRPVAATAAATPATPATSPPAGPGKPGAAPAGTAPAAAPKR
jgi:membrane fusion protein (multidrug efflux system)